MAEVVSSASGGKYTLAHIGFGVGLRALGFGEFGRVLGSRGAVRVNTFRAQELGGGIRNHKNPEPGLRV